MASHHVRRQNTPRVVYLDPETVPQRLEDYPRPHVSCRRKVAISLIISVISVIGGKVFSVAVRGKLRSWKAPAPSPQLSALISHRVFARASLARLASADPDLLP